MFKRILAMVSVLALGIAAVFMYANVAEAEEFVTDELVSFWTFDREDIDGGILKDVWGENHGNIESDPEIVEGRIDDALQFDGVDDLVEVPHDPSIAFAETSFSLEFYLKYTVGNTRVFCKGLSGGHGKRYEIAVDVGGVVTAIDDNITKSNCNVAVVDFSDWRHVVYIRDMDAGSILFYVDGEELLNCVDNTTDIGSENSLYFASRDPSEPDPMAAVTMDEVRMYNKALSADEVQQNYGVTNNSSAVSAAGKLGALWGRIKSSGL